jgi:hypothetical protein
MCNSVLTFRLLNFKEGNRMALAYIMMMTMMIIMKNKKKKKKKEISI